MDTLLKCWRLYQSGLKTGRTLDWERLTFGHSQEALWIAGLLALLAAVGLLLKRWKKDRPGKMAIVLPAVLPFMRCSPFFAARFLPLGLVILGLPFFFVALADPFLSFSREEVSYPGRRIAVLIDASGSMSGEFRVSKLKTVKNENFFTAAAAAEYFMRMRMRSRYKDLMSLIEFGNEAYVITPFTADYENILLSIRLIADQFEWDRFPDKGTKISRAISQSVQLFKTFGFLEASGNIMVIFSDGDDSDATDDGRPLDDILAEARQSKIPIYFIRTGYGKLFQGYDQQEFDAEGNVVGRASNDLLWGQAVEKTGGKFYAATDEEIILKAIDEINRAATGDISRRQYKSKQPKFTFFALAALTGWTIALFMFLSSKYFRRFP